VGGCGLEELLARIKHETRVLHTFDMEKHHERLRCNQKFSFISKASFLFLTKSD
jgi:hypothetical protein